MISPSGQQAGGVPEGVKCTFPHGHGCHRLKKKRCVEADAEKKGKKVSQEKNAKTLDLEDLGLLLLNRVAFPSLILC